MEDDDTFLVIVGNYELQEFPSIQIKQERFEEDEMVHVENVIETAVKHGEFMEFDIKRENESNDGDESQLQIASAVTIIKEELPDEDDTDFEENRYLIESIDETEDNVNETEDTLNETENNVNDTEDDVNDTEDSVNETEDNINETKPKKDKRKNRNRSFVQELRDQYPELRKNTDLLVQTLCEIMRNVKRPLLPDGHVVAEYENFKCSKCGHLSDTKNAASRHYQHKHGPRYLTCFSCGVDFRNTTNLYKHEKRCPGRDRRVVLMSRAACLGNKGRGRPFLSKAVQPPPVALPELSCSQCSAVFSSRTGLQSHEFLHRGQRPFQCHQCPAAYTSRSALARHEKKHSNIEFICDHCQRSFKLKVALVAHMDMHREVRRFGCKFCDRRFAQNQALKIHVHRVHHNLPPPHACQICPKRYPRMSLLKDHMKSEHGLTIMTKKMFYKKMPMLSDAEMKRVAKTVFKSEES